MKHAIARRRLFMTKNLIMMLVLAVVIVLAITAWFSFYKTVSADSISVKAVSTEIDVAESIKTYSNDYTEILTDGPGEFGSNVIFDGPYELSKDCTGDGVNLIVPEFNIANDFIAVKQTGKEVNTNLSANNAFSSFQSWLAKQQNSDQDAPEYQYISLDFYARSKNPNLLLEDGSKVLARTEVNGHQLSESLNDSDEKRSAYGSFNVDGVVGAVRVALVAQGCSSCTQTWGTANGQTTVVAADTTRGAAEKQLLWVPRPDVKLNVSPGEGITDWTLSTGLTSGDTFKHTYYKTKTSGTGVELVDPDNDSKTVVSSGTESGCKRLLGQSVNISDFSYSSQLDKLPLAVDRNHTGVTDDYYLTKYTMKIWLEGTDSESRRAMDGGDFDIVLYLK